MKEEGGGSILLASVFGIPVRVHFSFVLVILGVALYAAALGQSVGLALLMLLLLFVSLVLHELGHALAAKFLGVKTREIVLYPIGGRARLTGTPSGGLELCIAAAGPLVNLLAALVVLIISTVQGESLSLDPEGSQASYVLGTLFWSNVALFALNLLPAFPMDGGRILRGLMTLFMSEESATRVAAFVGQSMAVAVALIAIVVPSEQLGSLNVIQLLFALLVFFGAGQESAVIRTAALLKGRRASEAAITRFERLAPQDSLEWAGRLFLATHQRDFPVIDAWGRVAGMLDRAALMRGLAEHGAEAAVLEAMNREVVTVPPDAPLAEVVRLVQQVPGRPVVVQCDDGLLGLITVEKLGTFTDFVRHQRMLHRGPHG
ncbi:MAG: M50 family metallopeptidase [Acidobacteriota bacterium]